MRIVVAEDAAVVREGLVQLLRDRGLDVAAAVGDAEALLVAVEEHRPDVVVADIRMPPTHRDEGLRAALALRERYPDLGVLLFSQYVETRYANRLAATGMSGFGYLLKERVVDVGDFVDALHRVAAGGTALGAWISLRDPIVAETAASLGFDYVCVDLQHGLNDYDGMANALAAMAGSGATPLVRVPWNEPGIIGRALDAGAAGVIIPMVNSVEEAQRAASACHYWPAGTRSWPRRKRSPRSTPRRPGPCPGAARR